MRTCDTCGKEMINGYLVHDEEYYCCDDCLHSAYTPEEYKELFNEDMAYWTEWERGDKV